ncbi:MAG: nucleic acid-binding protein [Treponemataceae bacterium]|nr:nucleic acid-binding protein [Treponemataceae bacterium]
MVMTEVFERLKELQGVLAEKYMLEEKIEEAPKQLTSQDELLARLKKEYIEKNTKYDEVRASVEHLKAQLAEAEASRESGEKGMDSITTHREYEALDKQITEAKEREDAIRRDLTREEKTLAELNEILRTDEAMITAQEADLDSSRTSLAAEIDGYKQALGDLDKKEADITPGIDQEIVYKFQRIIRRNSEGIVAVKNGVCMGCHMILPAQFANEVRDGEKILFCPYCSRILYHQDVAEDEEETYFSMDETGSLADFDDDFGDEEDLLEEGEARDDGDGEKPLGFEE